MSITDISPIIYPSNTITAGATITLDAAEELTSVIIRVPKTGTLKRIGWRTRTVDAGTSYTLRISIETVAEVVGQPVSTTDAGKTLYSANATADITSGLASNTTYYTPINGSTGISVTVGDLIAVTFRLIAVNGASIQVRTVTSSAYIYGVSDAGIGNGDVYSASYIGGAWDLDIVTPMIALEYSDGFYPSIGFSPPCSQNNLTYNSGSANSYRGIKFRYPFKCRLHSVRIHCDFDGDANIILFDSDEYSTMSGFPISVNRLQRQDTSGRIHHIIFTTKPILEANTYYRLIILPTSTTDIDLTNFVLYDDSPYYGYDLTPEGDDLCLTSRNSAPTSGDHSWSDALNDKPYIKLLIDGIESSSGGSGISRSRQLMG